MCSCYIVPRASFSAYWSATGSQARGNSKVILVLNHVLVFQSKGPWRMFNNNNNFISVNVFSLKRLTGDTKIKLPKLKLRETNSLSGACNSLQATQMIDAIRASFKKGLPDLDWMDDKTRRAAEDKVLLTRQSRRVISTPACWGLITDR